MHGSGGGRLAERALGGTGPEILGYSTSRGSFLC